MQTKKILTALTLAAVTAAGVSTAALADRRGGPDGEGMMPIFNFEAMDADKDGKITTAEVQAHRAAMAKAADANGDGFLDAAELTAMEMERMKVRAENRATMMVKRMDTDGDAKLSAAELAAGPGPQRMFERIDADQDGAISQAELDAAKARMQSRGGMKGGHGKHGGRSGGGMQDDG